MHKKKGWKETWKWTNLLTVWCRWLLRVCTFLSRPFHLKNDDRLEHMNLNLNDWHLRYWEMNGLELAERKKYYDEVFYEWNICATKKKKKSSKSNDSLFCVTPFAWRMMNEILWFYWKNYIVTCLMASKSVIIIKIALNWWA